jgi:hypothetical protein
MDIDQDNYISTFFLLKTFGGSENGHLWQLCLQW